MQKLSKLKQPFKQKLEAELANAPLQKLFARRVLQIGADYSFSGVTLRGHSWEQFPAIRRLMSYANETLGLSFNSCLINEYTGLCGIGAHKDVEPCLDNIGVLSVSLGDSCPFIFRQGREVKQFILEDGDVFFWSAEENLLYTHEIPKQYFNKRVSLTFRKFR